MTGPISPPPTQGIVFACTGESYITLARRAARTLRRAAPGTSIDLFADQAVDDPVFDSVHRLNTTGRRPKMEALRRSRFDRTLCLDADICVTAPLDEVFTLLDRYDIAACHVALRNGGLGRVTSSAPVSFPMLNSGVIALRKSPETHAFLEDWQRRFETGKIRKDQPAFRDALWESDLRLGVLPWEYNLLVFRMLDSWTNQMTAPRVLHARELHDRDPGDPETPFELEELLSPDRAARVRELIEVDETLGGTYRPQLAPRRKRNNAPPRSRVRRVLRRIRQVAKGKRQTAP